VASPGASRREATRQEVAKRDGGARHRAASCAGTGRRQEKGARWAGPLKELGQVSGRQVSPGKFLFFYCFLFSVFLFNLLPLF
jgi:hypothetical protein